MDCFLSHFPSFRWYFLFHWIWCTNIFFEGIVLRGKYNQLLELFPSPITDGLYCICNMCPVYMWKKKVHNIVFKSTFILEVFHIVWKGFVFCLNSRSGHRKVRIKVVEMFSDTFHCIWQNNLLRIQIHLKSRRTLSLCSDRSGFHPLYVLWRQ